MPFDSPTIAELRDQARKDYQVALGLGPLNPRSTLGAIADGNAGQAFGLHEHLQFLAVNVLPSSVAESATLDRWGELLDVPRDQPVQATGSVDFTGSAGAVVTAGALLQTAGGVQFSVAADVTLSAGPTSVAVTAVVGGISGNTTAATAVSLVNPLAGVDTDATVGAGGITGGSDLQSDAAYLQELLDRLQNPPAGGRVTDYLLWAKEVPGVTRVYVQPLLFGVGTVGVIVLTDDAAGGPIPEPSVVTAVQELLEDGDHAPVGVSITVYAPNEVPIDPEIQLVGADTQAIRDAVEANLEAMLLDVVVPGSPVPLSKIREAISTSPGEVDHVLIAPTADVALTTGEIATLGTITWT